MEKGLQMRRNQRVAKFILIFGIIAAIYRRLRSRRIPEFFGYI